MKQFTKHHIGHKCQGQNSSLHLRDFIAPILNPYVLCLLHDGTRQRNVLVSKNKAQGFPGGAVVEGPPADAGDTGSCPGPGRSHMPRSGCAREPWPLSLRIRSLCSATGEATTVRGPHTAKNKTKQNKTKN